jgi:hypothetical protein
VNTSPITTYDGAEAYFTFGPDTVGTWIFVVLAALLFVWAIVRAVRMESRSLAHAAEDQAAAPASASTANGHLAGERTARV